jgi:Na+/proline symporter
VASIDFIVLASYLVFLLALGPVFNRFNRTASDYFRAGGTMVWWVAGTAIVMGMFSAWSFTGGAARVYETGFFFLVLFACNVGAMTFTYFVLAARFRQMRVVTGIEAVRKRFGPANEQVFTWIQVPLRLFNAGMALYVLTVFTAGAFPMRLGPVRLDMVTLTIVLGAVVTIMAVAGGAWAINAGQFVQGVIFLAITGVMVFATLHHPKIGGISGLLRQIPERHTHWTLFERPGVLVAFIATLLVNQLVQMNALQEGAGKYLIVKDGRDARRVTLMGIVAMILLTPMWMIPAMGAVVLHTDLGSAYPALERPTEAAYVAMAQTTLPPGLVGLLVCAIFSASLDSLSGGINVAAGILVRNFYIRVIDPAASDRRQVWVGRALSVWGGLAMIGVALTLDRYSRLPLYQLVLLFAAAIGLPQAVPMFLGLFVRRAPAWSLWSTLLVGLATSWTLQRYMTDPQLARILHTPAGPLGKQELTDLKIAVFTAVLLVICVGWFFLTTLLGRQSQEERAGVDDFFAEMNTPIDPATEHAGEAYESDARQYRAQALLSLTFGGFIAALAILPNTPTGRLGLAFCGGLTLLIGCALYVLARRGAATVTNRAAHRTAAARRAIR